MKRYIVLDRAGIGQTANAIVLRDGFGWLRFLFPWAWLMMQGARVTGALVLALQLALLTLGTPFDLLALVIALLVALEGPTIVALAMRRRGFVETAVHYGERRSDVEAVYFADFGPAQNQPSVEAAPRALPLFSGWRPARSLLATGDAR